MCSDVATREPVEGEQVNHSYEPGLQTFATGTHPTELRGQGVANHQQITDYSGL